MLTKSPSKNLTLAAIASILAHLGFLVAALN